MCNRKKMTGRNVNPGLTEPKGNPAVPMPGVRIGGEAKLLDDGVVPVGDG